LPGTNVVTLPRRSAAHTRLTNNAERFENVTTQSIITR